MEDEDYSEYDPDAAEGLTSSETPKRRRRSFTKLRRELNEEELSSPAVQKLLIDEIERLESENSSLSELASKYYDVDKTVAVLQEKDKQNVAMEVMSSVGLALGAVALGSGPSIWSLESSEALGWFTMGIGVVLMAASVITKFVRR